MSAMFLETNQIQRVFVVESSVNDRDSKVEISYEVECKPTNDIPMVTTRIDRLTLEKFDRVEDSLPKHLVIEAVGKGLGKELIGMTISRLGSKVNEPLNAYLPLFYSRDHEADIDFNVYAGFKLSPMEGRNYCRVGMLIYTPFDFLLEGSDYIDYAGQVYADLGFVSNSWSIKSIANAASLWFSRSLDGIKMEDKASLYNSCEDTRHKFLMGELDMDARQTIQSVIAPFCNKCFVNNLVRKHDVPF